MKEKIIGAVYLNLPKGCKDLIRNFVWKFHLSSESRKLFKLYSGFIKKGDLVFDVGTNYGNYAEIFLQLGARVVCLEPNPDLIRGLKKRFRDKVKIINKGVSSRQETKKFKIFKDQGHGTFHDSKPQGEKVIKVINVETITLSELIEKYGLPKFIKIDVEGFEYEVLKTLKRKVNGIAFEFSPSKKEVVKDCMDHLKKIGYKDFNFSYIPEFKLELSNWSENPLEFIKKRGGDLYAKH
jgi:FkbM family methyltransferase